MALENKLGLTSSADLAREEERISKKKAVWLFESGTLDKLFAGTFASLQAIHRKVCGNERRAPVPRGQRTQYAHLARFDAEKRRFGRKIGSVCCGSYLPAHLRR